MKASRFSDARKAFILKQGADGMPVAEINRRAGISQATLGSSPWAAGQCLASQSIASATSAATASVPRSSMAM